MSAGSPTQSARAYDPNRPTTVVIWGASRWAQKALHLLLTLNRDYWPTNPVTIWMIVERKDEGAFRTRAPSYKSAIWDTPTAKKNLIEVFRNPAVGPHASYYFDDQVPWGELNKDTTNVVGYVASSAENHFRGVEAVAKYCHRLLIEKPVSRIAEDVAADGHFAQLLNSGSTNHCDVRAVEHYLFRESIEAAIYGPQNHLREFLGRHAGHKLHYEFRFLEEAGRENPNDRLPAFQDGAILDVLSVHGFGPLIALLLPCLAGREDFFVKALDSCHSGVRGWRAMAPAASTYDPDLHVAVFAETAAMVEGTLDERLSFTLVSGKGQHQNDRYFRVMCLECEAQTDVGHPYFGASLGGDAGHSVWAGENVANQSYRELTSGLPKGLDAQQTMLRRLVEDEELDSRFMRVADQCACVRFGLAAQRVLAQDQAYGRYEWGSSLPEHELRCSVLVDKTYASAKVTIPRLIDESERQYTVICDAETDVAADIESWKNGRNVVVFDACNPPFLLPFMPAAGESWWLFTNISAAAVPVYQDLVQALARRLRAAPGLRTVFFASDDRRVCGRVVRASDIRRAASSDAV